MVHPFSLRMFCHSNIQEVYDWSIPSLPHHVTWEHGNRNCSRPSEYLYCSTKCGGRYYLSMLCCIVVTIEKGQTLSQLLILTYSLWLYEPWKPDIQRGYVCSRVTVLCFYATPTFSFVMWMPLQLWHLHIVISFPPSQQVEPFSCSPLSSWTCRNLQRWISYLFKGNFGSTLVGLCSLCGWDTNCTAEQSSRVKT